MKKPENPGLLLIISLLLIAIWLMNSRIDMLRDNIESLRSIVYQMLLASPPAEGGRPFYPPDKKKEMET